MRSLIFAVLFAFAAFPALAQENEKPAQAGEKQAETQAKAQTAAQAAGQEYEPPPGWKTRHRGDKTIYCRKDTEIGSRFPVEKCFTKEQLEIELERIEMMKEEFERHRRVCSDATLCGSS